MFRAFLVSNTGGEGIEGELEREDAGVGSALLVSVVRVGGGVEWPFGPFAVDVRLGSKAYGVENVRDRCWPGLLLSLLLFPCEEVALFGRE